MVVDLDSAHLRADSPRVNHDGVPHLHFPRNQGAGDHRAEPLHRENTVHREPEERGRRTDRYLPAQPVQRLDEFSQPCPVAAETGITGAFSRNESRVNSRCPPGRAPAYPRPPDRPSSVPPARSGPPIGCKFHVFAGLRHHALVGAMTMATMSIPVAPATMFLNELFMAGNVHHAQLRAAGKIQMANPSSMVMPRSFSSFRRSVSIP